MEEKIVLLLDGLDEADIPSAKNAIENFHARHPKSKIVVSCRSNSYTANTLQNFEKFYLEKLSQFEIQQYVQKTLGRRAGDQFLENWQSRYPWHQNNLLDNPFFLINICDFVKDKKQAQPGSLAEVFEYLIEKSIEKRLKSTANFGSGNVEKQREALRRSLEKLAFAMECRGENQISRQIFEQIFTDEQAQIDLLEKSSLLELRSGSVQFAHNNFQEYLAAWTLARAKDFKTILQAIAIEPDRQRLKWSWTNALAFLFSIWEDGEPLKNQLLDWLTESDIGVIIKIGTFEKEKISGPTRQRVFEKIFADSKRDGLRLGYQHYNYWELAEFAAGADSLRFLFEELKNAESSLVKCNALVLLKSMDVLVPGDIRAGLRAVLLDNIFDFEKNDSTTRHFAIEALIQLFDDIQADETGKIVEAFFDSDDASERTAACQLITKTGLQKNFMAQIVRRSKELEDHDWKKGQMTLMDEGWRVKQCFKAMKSEPELIAYFQNYADQFEEKDRFSSNKWLNQMLKKLAAADLQPAAAQQIFEAMREPFTDMVSFISRSGKDSVRQFLEKNKLELQFLQFCVEQGKRIDVSSQFLNEEGVEFLAGKFRDGEAERVWMESYISWAASGKNDWLPQLVEKLNLLVPSNEPPFEIPKPQPPIDYAERDRQKLLVEKQLYFDKEKLIAAVNEIFEIHGEERFEKGKIYEFRQELDKEDRDVYGKYPHSLLWFLDAHSGQTREEILQFVEANWEWISISQIQNYLSRDGKTIEKYPELGLTDAETAIVRNWCDRHARTMNLSKNELTHGDIAFAWFTIFCKFTHFDERIYLQMIDSRLQHFLLEELLQFLETEDVLPFQKIKKEVLKVLARGDASGAQFFRYLEFAKRHELCEALDFLPNYIEEKLGQSDNRNYALQVFIELGGSREYLLGLLQKISPSPEDYRENTLLNVLAKQPDPDFEKTLLQKLAQSTEPEQQLICAKHLLRFDNLVALQFLVNFIERERKSPFSRRLDDSVYRFENISGLSLLLRFFDFGHDETIPQDHFDKISYAGRQMLQHLATFENGKYFRLVRQNLQEYWQTHTWLNESGAVKNGLLPTVRPSAVKEIQYFIKDLEFHFYQRQEVSVPDALKLFEQF